MKVIGKISRTSKASKVNKVNRIINLAWAIKLRVCYFFPFYLSKKICINRGMVVSGTMEKLAGTLKRDEGMKERGQVTKVSI